MEGRSALALLLFAATLSHAFGDHFRGGHLSWRPTDQTGQVSGRAERCLIGFISYIMVYCVGTAVN